MLGQVRHRQHCANATSGYQEVDSCLFSINDIKAFVIQAHHATFYLFYAAFPNAYLVDIAQHGANYLRRGLASSETEVPLYQARPFRMRYPTEQAAFFRLLVKLLHSLHSGQSRIGHLCNVIGNPFVRHDSEFRIRRFHDNFASLDRFFSIENQYDSGSID
jgi:hypothetical protein